MPEPRINSMPNPISIGIDPGLSNLGIGIVDSEGGYVDNLVLRTDKDSGVWGKGSDLYWQLEELFAAWNSEHSIDMQLAAETRLWQRN